MIIMPITNQNGLYCIDIPVDIEGETNRKQICDECIPSCLTANGYTFLGFKFKNGMVRNTPFYYNKKDNLILTSASCDELQDNSVIVIYAISTVWI